MLGSLWYEINASVFLLQMLGVVGGENDGKEKESQERVSKKEAPSGAR